MFGDVSGDGDVAEFSQCAEQPTARLRGVFGNQLSQVKGPHAVKTGSRLGWRCVNGCQYVFFRDSEAVLVWVGELWQDIVRDGGEMFGTESIVDLFTGWGNIV